MISVEFLVKRVKFFALVSSAVLCISGIAVSCQESGESGPKPVPFEGQVQAGQAVDLGLSVQWAGYNVGATAPEQMGELFAWGETSTKSDGYEKSNYSMWDGVNYSPYGSDGATRLSWGEDIATAAWGDGWRMPSEEEIDELLDSCTWTYSTYKGVRGYVVTASEKAGGRSIFFPLPGYQVGTAVNHRDIRGIYWGSQLSGKNSDYGVTLFVNEETAGRGQMHRYLGAAVRPVCVTGGSSQQAADRTFPDVAGILSASKIIADVAWESTTDLAEGVKVTDMVATLSSGHPETIHIITADLEQEGLHMHVARPDNSLEIPAGEWPRQTLSAMAAALDSDDDKVVAMVNSSFWHTSTFTPRGPVHSAGNVLWSEFQPTTKQGLSYVGYTTAGVMRIGDSEEYSVTSPGVFTDLTGSGLILVRKGKAQSDFTDVDREPRTAIGYTQDNYLYLMVVDGRNPGISEGVTMEDMAAIFVSLGCYAAVNVDGGGSSQMLVRTPGTDSFKIHNSPSDGAERPVIDAWAVMVK